MRHRYRLALTSLWLTALAPLGAAAFEPMAGCFVAEAACPAPTSTRRAGNPDAITTEPGRSYPLLGANQKPASYFQIRIPAADPIDRWVEAACGHTVPTCGPSERQPARPDPAPGPDYVLAASWQPAFCESHRRTPECRSQTAARFDATSLALHGLWPEPRSNAWCGVSQRLRATDEAGRWDELPPLDLSDRTRADLAVAMPGTRSDLDRHEWLRHGTCSGLSAEAYFTAALALLQELNRSPVRSLLAARVGQDLSAPELRAAFDRAFGGGAGRRVELACDDGLILELRLHLRGGITPPTALATLLAAAPAIPPGCPAGRIDPAGFARDDR